MKLSYDKILPELLVEGIEKWFLFLYDDFITYVLYGHGQRGKLKKVCDWCAMNDIGWADIDTFYYNREDFRKFSKGIVPFTEKDLVRFMSEKVLDDQPRELFMGSTYIVGDEKIVLYLEKGIEIVLVGLPDLNLAKSFEEKVEPYSEESLKEKLDFIARFPLCFHPNPLWFIKMLEKNYFS